MDSSLNSTHQPSSSSGIPSQPLPNPKGGINAITLRFETTLQERNHEEPSPLEHVPAEDMVEVEDAEEEEDVQDIVAEEEAQPQNALQEKYPFSHTFFKLHLKSVAYS